MTATCTSASAENATANLAALCRERAATYRLLGRFFISELDADFLETLKAMRLPAKTGNEMIDEGYRLIARYLGGFWDTSFTESSVDFTRTFVGHGNEGHSAAYPTESVYTSEKHLTMQGSRDEVMAFYRTWGLERSESIAENKDHITVELEFLAALSERYADCLERGEMEKATDLLAAQQQFLDEHVLRWAKVFAQGIRVFSRTDLYQGAGYLLEGFLTEDRAFLNEILDADDEEKEA